MSINARTLALANDRRMSLDRALDAQTLDLVRAWVLAWEDLTPEFDAALTDLIASARDGRVTGSKVAQNLRLRKALQLAADRIAALAEDAQVIIARDVATTALAAAQSQIAMIQSQLPPAGQVAALPTFTQVSAAAMDAIVLRSTQQITSRLLPVPAEVEALMKKELVRAVAVGDNPRVTARRMLRATEGRFNLGLTRAMVISRTEILDSHRAATMAADKANTDIMAAWIWGASLDARTCPSCLSKHGTEYPVDEPGPLDHHQGRCDRIPKTKSWAELGFKDIVEPPSLIQDSREWFDGLTADTQRSIMGDERLKLLNDGTIQWSDLSMKKSTDGWRDSFHVTPVRDLRPPA